MVQIQQQLHSCPSFSSSLLASIRSRFAGPNPAWPPVAHLITSPHGSRSSTENRGFSVDIGDLLKPFGMQYLRWSVSVQRTPWSHVPHFALPSFRTVLYLTVSAYFTTSAPPGLKYRCAPLVWTPSVLRPCSELGAMATSYPVQLKTSAGSKRPAKSQRLFLLTDIWCPVLCSSALKTAKNSPFSIHPVIYSCAQYNPSLARCPARRFGPLRFALAGILGETSTFLSPFGLEPQILLSPLDCPGGTLPSSRNANHSLATIRD